jgi:hypothetical protein
MNTLDVGDVVSALVPKPSPFSLKRIGGKRDGAYLVPDDLEGIVACFSPGVNNFKYFEDELTYQFGIRCHMCDFSSDVEKFSTPMIEGMQTFKKLWLDVDGRKDSISLERWVQELEPNPNQDLLLQMDIEGAEYRNLLGCPETILRRFRVIVLELHGLAVAKNPKKFQGELGTLLRILDEHFLCVHAHPNNCCGDFILPGLAMNLPNVIEVSFLRRDRFEGREAIFPPSLPHPLDIRANVASKPPLFLNAAWSSGGARTLQSSMKVLEDKVAYFESRGANGGSENRENVERIIIAYNRAFQRATLNDKGGGLASAHGTLLELAEGKKYVLSSSFGQRPKEGIVESSSTFFFHTGFGVDQYFTVDLCHRYRLCSLEVVNRIDAARERARCLFYLIHDEETPSLDLGIPLFVSRKFWTDKGAVSVTPLSNAVGRYLTIYSNEHTAIHLSSLKILGASVDVDHE